MTLTVCSIQITLLCAVCTIIVKMILLIRISKNPELPRMSTCNTRADKVQSPQRLWVRNLPKPSCDAQPSGAKKYILRARWSNAYGQLPRCGMMREYQYQRALAQTILRRPTVHRHSRVLPSVNHSSCRTQAAACTTQRTAVDEAAQLHCRLVQVARIKCPPADDDDHAASRLHTVPITIGALSASLSILPVEIHSKAGWNVCACDRGLGWDDDYRKTRRLDVGSTFQIASKLKSEHRRRACPFLVIGCFKLTNEYGPLLLLLRAVDSLLQFLYESFGARLGHGVCFV